MRIESSQRPTGRARALAAPLLLALALGGCASGPDYRAPATPSAAAGPFVSQSERTNAGAELPSDWWRLYDDATLNGLLQEALAANPTCARRWPIWTRRARSTARPGSGCCRPPSCRAARVMAATTRLAAATARRPGSGVTAAGWKWPMRWTCSDGCGATSKRPATTPTRSPRRRGQGAGRGRHGARYLNACAYGVGAGGPRVHALAQRNLDLISEQERAGSASRLDAERAGVALARTEAALAPIEARRSAALFELAALLGRTPAQVPQAARACASPPEPGGAIPVGDGAALLRRRPDLRQAERRLAADTARIGVAVADLYPRVTLGASGSYLRNDTLTGDRAWSFALGPLVSWSFPNIAAARSRIERRGAERGLAGPLRRRGAERAERDGAGVERL